MHFLIILILFASVQDTLRTQGCVDACGVVLLEVIGLKNNDGDVKIGLYNSSESFEGKSKTKFKTAVVPIYNKKSQCIFTDVPYGDYAIKLFHDEDGNGKLNTSFLGIPTEDYGFSNNAKSFFGISSFEDAKIVVSSDTLKIEINVN